MEQQHNRKLITVDIWAENAAQTNNVKVAYRFVAVAGVAAGDVV